MYLKTKNNIIFELKDYHIIGYGGGLGVEAEYKPVMGLPHFDWRSGWFNLVGVKIRLRIQEL